MVHDEECGSYGQQWKIYRLGKMRVIFGIETEVFGFQSQDQILWACAGQSRGGEKIGGQALEILLFYEVMKAEPCWCGGNKKKGTRASDHATFGGMSFLG